MAAEETLTCAGYVYFFRSPATGHTKIGFSAVPERRFSDIGSYVTDLVCVGVVGSDDPRWLEQTLHRAFAKRRQKGEWFALTDDDINLCCTLPDHVNASDELPDWIASYAVKERKRERKPVVFITMDDDTESSLQKYIATYEVPPDRAAVGLHAIREFLTSRGYYPPKN